MSVKLAKNGTWLAQFRCRDKFGNEVHKCKRGFASAEEAQAWEDEFIDTAGGTMEMTFGDFFKVYEADLPTCGPGCASTPGGTFLSVARSENTTSPWQHARGMRR